MAVYCKDGVNFDRVTDTSRLVATVHKLANGHIEAAVRHPTVSREIGPVIQYPRGPGEVDPPPDPAEEAERLLRRREKAAARAKTNVRKKAKQCGADALLTLTYRENQTCLQTAKQHLVSFIKRLTYVLGPAFDFRYIAVPERQKRGAIHWHIAIRRLPAHIVTKKGLIRSFDLLRRLWRKTIAGEGGNIDVTRDRGAGARSPMRIASYIAKYMTKDADQWPPGVRRYHSSILPLPPKETIVFEGYALADVIQILYDTYACGKVETQAFLGRFKDCFWLAVHGEAS